jgi:hypothetical protein
MFWAKKRLLEANHPKKTFVQFNPLLLLIYLLLFLLAGSEV